MKLQLKLSLFLLPLFWLAALPQALLAQDELDEDQAYEAQRQRREQQELLRRQQIRRLGFPFNTIPEDPIPFQLGYRQGLQQMFPRFEGFSKSERGNPSGFGGYPSADPGSSDLPVIPMPTLRTPEMDVSAWPSWIEGGVADNKELYSPQHAVLLRGVDRVWFLQAGEDAYVPLAHYDRFRYVSEGCEVQVPGRGEFQVFMHDGAILRSIGGIHLRVLDLAEAQVELQLMKASNFWVQAKARPVTVLMPDGSKITVSSGLLHIQLSNDRYVVANEGPVRGSEGFSVVLGTPAGMEDSTYSKVVYSTAVGSGELFRSQELFLWPQSGRKAHHADDLRLYGQVRSEDEAAGLLIRGGDDGRVQWSGAQFRVPTGASLFIHSAQ